MQNLPLRGLPRVDLEALIEERQYSQNKWAAEFDSKNTLNDWIAYICMYASSAGRIFRSDQPELIYKKLIKAANLCLLAAERVRTGERGRRHYDPEYLGQEVSGVFDHGGPSRDDLPVDDDVLSAIALIRPGGDGIPLQDDDEAYKLRVGLDERSQALD